MNGAFAGERIAGLQALRGIAALAVFVQHLIAFASAVAPGPVERLSQLGLGGIGVFTFFALSAALMVEKASDPPGRFLLDRARRIYPLFWLSIVATVLLNAWIEVPSFVTWQLVLLLPFGPAPELLVPYWTLFYELLFYLLVAGVAAVSRRLVVPVLLAWSAAAFVLASRPYGGALTYGNPAAWDLLLPMMAVYFGFGILARLGFSPRTDRRGRVIGALYAAGALVGFFGFTTLRPLYAALGIPGHLEGDALFLQVGLGAFCAVRAAACWPARGPVGRALRMVGDRSYGLYLIHLVLLGVATSIVVRTTSIGAYWLALGVLAATVLPFALLFGEIDVRMQRALKRLLARDRRAVAASAAGA